MMEMKRNEKSYVNELLTGAGLKNTKPRYAVASALANSETPVTAGEIFVRVSKDLQRANISTVYRTLETMLEKGLAEKNVLNDGTARYQLCVHEHRHHLVCTACSRMVPIEGCPLAEIEKKVGQKTSFDITGHRLELYGLCPDCKNRR
jgi:Fur family ferric uptake transcriptional regulator